MTEEILQRVIKENADKMREYFKEDMKGMIEGVEMKIESLDRKLSSRMDKMDERFDKIDERFDRIDERFDKMDERFDRMDERFDAIEERVVNVENIATVILEEIKDHHKRISFLEEENRSLRQQITEMAKTIAATAATA